MNFKAFLVFSGYAVVFFGALFGTVWWERWQRRKKPPFPEDLRLLRMPGEYLWRRIMENNESELQWSAALVAPLLIGATVIQFLQWGGLSSQPLSLLLALIIFLASIFLAVWWLRKTLQRTADDYLGLFGERYVAEWLDPLKTRGWFIFHDIQCTGKKGKFNLDHVAVGPGGIWLVETKVKRKGGARPGFKEHEVIFDGSKVIWPWGENTKDLKQAADNACWLSEWLETMTGKAFAVAPVLTFPGYFVIERKLCTVRVVNPKVLAQVFTSLGQNVLNPDDIDLVRRQLEARCRDVEY